MLDADGLWEANSNRRAGEETRGNNGKIFTESSIKTRNCQEGLELPRFGISKNDDVAGVQVSE